MAEDKAIGADRQFISGCGVYQQKVLGKWYCRKCTRENLDEEVECHTCGGKEKLPISMTKSIIKFLACGLIKSIIKMSGLAQRAPWKIQPSQGAATSVAWQGHHLSKQ
jgi:hypothetical protein